MENEKKENMDIQKHEFTENGKQEFADNGKQEFKEKQRISYRRQYITAFCCTIITFAAGTGVGWTSPSLPKLEADDSPIPISAGDGSWIASMYILVSASSVLPAAYLSDRIGRKRTLLLASLPFAAGWILIICATSKVELFISRALSGIGYGIAYTVAPQYLGEIASNEVRGALACMITLMNKAGILTQYSIGPYVNFRVLAGIDLVFPILFAITFFWQPESPHFYVKKSKTDEAQEELRRLLSKDDVKAELNRIEDMIAEQNRNKGKWSDLIKVAGNRNALIMCLVVVATQQLCGSAAITMYAEQIFMEASGNLGASESSIIIGSVQLVVSFLSVLLVDRVGRKPLLTISSLGVALANATIGTYFYIQSVDPESTENIGWLPVLTIMVFIICYNVGLAAVPFAIISEMFPSNLKFHASSTIQMTLSVLTFIVTKLYQVIADEYGTYVIFWAFAFFSVVGFILILWKLPETKGQSFSVIQDKLNGSNSKAQI